MKFNEQMLDNESKIKLLAALKFRLPSMSSENQNEFISDMAALGWEVDAKTPSQKLSYVRLKSSSYPISYIEGRGSSDLEALSNGIGKLIQLESLS